MAPILFMGTWPDIRLFIFKPASRYLLKGRDSLGPQEPPTTSPLEVPSSVLFVDFNLSTMFLSVYLFKGDRKNVI
jgi:hypothetical protein